MIVQSYRVKFSSDLNLERITHCTQVCGKTSDKIVYVASILFFPSCYWAVKFVALFAVLALPPASSLQHSSSDGLMNITRKVGTDLHFLCPASIYTHSVAWPRAWTITDLTEQFGAIGLILRSVRGTGCQSTSSDLSGIATESPWCKYEQISGQQTLVMNYFQHPISGKIVSPFEEKEKKKNFFLSLSERLHRTTWGKGGEEQISNRKFFFVLLGEKLPPTNQNKMEPWSPTCRLEEIRRRKGRCLVPCQAFSTAPVALWCGT